MWRDINCTLKIGLHVSDRRTIQRRFSSQAPSSALRPSGADKLHLPRDQHGNTKDQKLEEVLSKLSSEACGLSANMKFAMQSSMLRAVSLAR